MKKLIVFALVTVLALSMLGNAFAMPNPWTDTDADGLREMSGMSFNVPENAENVVYRYLESEGLAEVDFTLNGGECCYRMKAVEAEEDISGMYVTWDNEAAAEVGGCEAKVVSNSDAVMVSWCDSLPGNMYCLVLQGKAAAVNAVTVADELFVPTGDGLFADLEGLEFWFCSGAGGWNTTVRFAADGSFTGDFHDSEMGESAEEYPNGTVYGCLFHGKCTDAEQVSEYVWKVKLESLELDEGQVPEYIDYGIRFVTYEEVYGLEDTDELLVYLPGMPIEELSESYLMWAQLSEEQLQGGVLPFFGLYNENGEYGFTSLPEVNE